MIDVRGKRVLVVGLARSGRAVALCLRRHGAVVTVTDTKPPAAFGTPPAGASGAKDWARAWVAARRNLSRSRSRGSQPRGAVGFASTAGGARARHSPLSLRLKLRAGT